MTDEIVYICNRCGETFTLEEGRTLRTDEGDITLCPNCGTDDIEEGERCKICREIRYPWSFTGRVCNECFNDAKEAYKSCLRSLMGWEKEALEDHYGIIDITEREE